jgi:hypothetical protein
MNYLIEHYKKKAEDLQEEYNFLTNIICLLETSEADKILDMMMGWGGRNKPHSFESLSPEEKAILQRATEELKAKDEARTAARNMSSEERTRLAGTKVPSETPSVSTDGAYEGKIKGPAWRSRQRSAIPKSGIFKPKTNRFFDPEVNFAKPYELLDLKDFTYDQPLTPLETSYNFAGTQTPPKAPPVVPTPPKAPPVVPTPPKAPPVVPTPPKAPPVVPTSSTKRIGTGTKIGLFGAGLATGFGADYATQKALEAAGVENQMVKSTAGTAANVGVGMATELGLGALAGGAGGKAAIGTALRALPGYAVAGALGNLAGEYAVKPLASIEYKLPGEKGNAKSTIDRLGEVLYQYDPTVKTVTNLIAGNKLTAGMGSLNTKPTGVAGGDAAKIAQNQKEEEEERLATEKKAAERSARIAAKVAQFKAQEANQ